MGYEAHDFILTRPCHTIGLKLVMAEQSQQNVVVHPQSADGPPSVDVSVNAPTESAARAAAAEKFQATIIPDSDRSTDDNNEAEFEAPSTDVGKDKDFEVCPIDSMLVVSVDKS
jgi:hypothetical protein